MMIPTTSPFGDKLFWLEAASCYDMDLSFSTSTTLYTVNHIIPIKLSALGLSYFSQSLQNITIDHIWAKGHVEEGLPREILLKPGSASRWRRRLSFSLLQISIVHRFRLWVYRNGRGRCHIYYALVMLFGSMFFKAKRRWGWDIKDRSVLVQYICLIHIPIQSLSISKLSVIMLSDETWHKCTSITLHNLNLIPLYFFSSCNKQRKSWNMDSRLLI